MCMPYPLFPGASLGSGGDALLRQGVDYLCDIGWRGGGGGINHVGRQDSGIESAEGVVIGAGKIFLVGGFR